MGCEAYLLRRGAKGSSSGEAGRPASPSATARVLFEARRAVALPMDQSRDGGRGGSSEAHGDPGRAGPKNLPRTVRTRDWPMSLPNYPVERTGLLAPAAHRSVVRTHPGSNPTQLAGGGGSDSMPRWRSGTSSIRKRTCRTSTDTTSRRRTSRMSFVGRPRTALAEKVRASPSDEPKPDGISESFMYLTRFPTRFSSSPHTRLAGRR